MSGNLRRAAYLLGLIAIWEAASSLLGQGAAGGRAHLPAPHAILGALVDGARQGWLGAAVATSLRRLALGFSLAAVTGLVLGLLLGRVRILSESIGLAVLGLQAVPSACWI